MEMFSYQIENLEKMDTIYDEENKLWSNSSDIIDGSHAKRRFTNEYGQKILNGLLQNGSGLAQVFERLLLNKDKELSFDTQKKSFF